MMRGYRFYIIVTILVLVILSTVTMTVNATESKRLQHNNEFYEEMEDIYLEALRETLSDKGYRNAGITMTKIFYENEEREYTVKIHHKRMERLSVEEKTSLLVELSEIGFTHTECRVCLKIV